MEPKVEMNSSDLSGMVLLTLTGPEYWSYEGVLPHFHVVKHLEKYYAFWNDKDGDAVIDFLLSPVEERRDWRFMADSLEKLISIIDEHRKKRSGIHN